MMISPFAEARPTTLDILSHEWMQGETATSKQVMEYMTKAMAQTKESLTIVSSLQAQEKFLIRTGVKTP